MCALWFNQVCVFRSTDSQGHSLIKASCQAIDGRNTIRSSRLIAVQYTVEMGIRASFSTTRGNGCFVSVLGEPAAYIHILV